MWISIYSSKMQSQYISECLTVLYHKSRSCILRFEGNPPFGPVTFLSHFRSQGTGRPLRTRCDVFVDVFVCEAALHGFELQPIGPRFALSRHKPPLHAALGGCEVHQVDHARPYVKEVGTLRNVKRHTCTETAVPGEAHY